MLQTGYLPKILFIIITTDERIMFSLGWNSPFSSPPTYPLSRSAAISVSYTHLDVYKRQVISSAHNVLSIPVSSLNRGNTVYIKGDKTDENDSAPEGYRTVTVVTGASDDEYIEIKNGLAEGDVLYSSSSSATPFSDQSMTEQREHAMDNMGSGGGPGGGCGPGGGM